MKRYLLAAVASAALAASPAAARDHSGYFGIEVGPMWAQDSHVRFPDITDGAADFDVDHKMGVDGDLIAGYDFGMRVPPLPLLGREGCSGNGMAGACGAAGRGV